MHKHPVLTLQRLQRFLEDHLEAKLIGKKVPLSVGVCHDATIKDEKQARKAEFKAVRPGYRWGPVWSTSWFHITGHVPDDWVGEKLEAVIDLGAETTVWVDNTPREGLDRRHRYYHYEGGPEVDLIAEAYTPNPHVSDRGRPAPPPEKPATVGEAFLFLPDPRLRAYAHDFKVALQLLEELPRDEPRFGRLLYAMNASVNALMCKGVASAAQALHEEWNQPAHASAHLVSAIGHAHLDTAWLWPLEITVKKAAHTFATATRYMDLYPDYKFVASQAAQYEWILNRYPGLFERIKEWVRRGQWEVTGSMWVEADCNLASGEALVRQFLFGKRFFKEHFGVNTKDMWLPDVFGYSASLPQIMKLAGIEYFMTQKISWNQFNTFPHHTFLWRGIDGTGVFSHFLPANDYNAAMTPRKLLFNVHNFADHDRARRSLFVYGYGDGGGGPTTDMIDAALRMRDVEGLPRVEMERACDFFAAARDEARDLPEWWGELYLELHRGTYTTQAKIKKQNRRAELLLRDAEMLAALLLAPSEYPRAEFAEAWKLALLNQFHDILPGSSVSEVYRDCDVDYARIDAILEPIIERSLGKIARGDGKHVVAVSTREHAPGGSATVPVPTGKAPKSLRWGDAQPTPVQVADGKLLFRPPDYGLGFTSGTFSDEPGEPSDLRVDERSLENEHLRVALNNEGDITSIIVKAAGAGIVAEGRVANQFELMDDEPHEWEAWEIDLFAHETKRPVGGLESIEVVESGPVRAALRVVRRFGESRIDQCIRLLAGSPVIEFYTEMDWHEDRKLLKVAFPVRVNSPRASYEIQFGHAERPTHYNTSWDLARFEVCAQKWVDLSDGTWGAALLNDCKYGHDILGNTIRLTLLRSPQAPDPEADRGHHQFTYALYPHVGSIKEADVVGAANLLNSPVRCFTTGTPPDPRRFVQVEAPPHGPKLIVEAVKRAEDSDAVVVRLYEAANSRGAATVRFGFPVEGVSRCDLLEKDIEELHLEDDAVRLRVRPFEIISLKLR
jgi:alpha-mannosidase